MKSPLRLLCDSNPMCYGSSAALVSILDHVADCQRTAIADGVTLELLGRDEAIDEIVNVNPKNSVAVAAALADRTFDAVLVVSNLSNIELYAQRGFPIFFVDILYWMGAAKVQPVWNLAEATFVEAFPGVAERLDSGQTLGKPMLVGPLIRTRPVTSSTASRTDVLVNLGGGRSRLIVPGVNSAYAQMVLSWLHAAGLADSRRVTVAGGKEAILDAGSAQHASKFELGSLPQEKFLELLGGAGLYLTVPGLNAVHEGLAAGVPLGFLPPQNATQVLQLQRYEDAGLIEPGLNLPALDPKFDTTILEGSEDELTAEVLQSLGRIERDVATMPTVARHLRQQEASWPERAVACARFRERLGPPGGADVATTIRTWWEKAC